MINQENKQNLNSNTNTNSKYINSNKANKFLNFAQLTIG